MEAVGHDPSRPCLWDQGCPGEVPRLLLDHGGEGVAAEGERGDHAGSGGHDPRDAHGGGLVVVVLGRFSTTNKNSLN